MSAKVRIPWRLAASIVAAAALTAGGAAAWGAAPSPVQALKLAPVQKDVDCDRPSPAEAAKCTIKAEKREGRTGWVIRDADGRILREFVDTNGDNVVDRWSYYKDGVEVYRDIDTKFDRPSQPNSVGSIRPASAGEWPREQTARSMPGR